MISNIVEGEFTLKEQTLNLFKTLTELPGASGNEHLVRNFMREQLAQYSDEIVQDKLGSIFGVKKGNQTGPTIMVAGHMDEVGFMVTQITDNGMIRFQPLGGWWSQGLISSAGSGNDKQWTYNWSHRLDSTSFIR